jgi:hypothetical protein
MQAATKLSSAPKETKSPTPDRRDETTVRRPAATNLGRATGVAGQG